MKIVLCGLLIMFSIMMHGVSQSLPDSSNLQANGTMLLKKTTMVSQKSIHTPFSILEPFIFPDSVSYYKRWWHVIPRDIPATPFSNTNTITSVFESELYRLNAWTINLSEMYLLYWQTVEKVRECVVSKGIGKFSINDLPIATGKIVEQYGLIPNEHYEGVYRGKVQYNLAAMYRDIECYLRFVSKVEKWNDSVVVNCVKSIMGFHIGHPPSTFKWNNQTITPVEFYKQTGITNDYVLLMSDLAFPLNKKINPSPKRNYPDSVYNISLDYLIYQVRDALERGYSVIIITDSTEQGFNRNGRYAVVSEYDIPNTGITQYARQLRLNNKNTTADNLFHLVGFLESEGEYWYLIKDTSFNPLFSNNYGDEAGYIFFREDYIKLKTTGIVLLKSSAEAAINKTK